jgi:hypothetical protein
MAYEFNGTTQYLNTSSSPVSTYPLTLACWFNSDNVTNNETLIRLSNTSAPQNPNFNLRTGGATSGDPIAVTAFQGGGTAEVTNSTTGYSANIWNHACGVFSNTTSRTVYLNAGGSATGTLSVNPVGMNSIYIGAGLDSFGNLTLYMDGRIAEVGIWNAALTAAEVASLAKGMTCDKVRPQSLVFYAPLVRNLIDAKGGLTITNNNGATVANHPRVYA